MATDTAEIGHRARTIRRQGLSLEVAAGLAGISTSYLSRLGRGERSIERRVCWRTWPPPWGAPWLI
ncbi:MAG: helix-turn-helix domain-containing protein [Pseudonocardiaceae bacterium]